MTRATTRRCCLLVTALGLLLAQPAIARNATNRHPPVKLWQAYPLEQTPKPSAPRIGNAPAPKPPGRSAPVRKPTAPLERSSGSGAGHGSPQRLPLATTFSIALIALLGAAGALLVLTRTVAVDRWARTVSLRRSRGRRAPQRSADPRPAPSVQGSTRSGDPVNPSSTRERVTAEAPAQRLQTLVAAPRATPVPQRETAHDGEDLVAALVPRLPGDRVAASVVVESDTCRIAVWHGYVKTQFYAAQPGTTMQQALRLSPMFRAPGGSEPQQTEEAEQALADVLAALEHDGWIIARTGGAWFDRTFERISPAG